MVQIFMVKFNSNMATKLDDYICMQMCWPVAMNPVEKLTDTSQTSSYTSHHQSSWMTDVIRRSLRERHTHPGSPKMDRI